MGWVYAFREGRVLGSRWASDLGSPSTPWDFVNVQLKASAPAPASVTIV
ncbi:hypothetical protein TIFTF001_036545, partial [Ficus carica]